MRKENPSIKTTLSMEDRILMPQELAEGYFTKDSEGHVNYTPYYADMMLINVFFLHCVDGIAFEVKEAENGGTEIAENIYEAVTADEELMKLYDEFFEQDKDSIPSCPYKETVIQMYGILSDTEKMVEFRKQQIIHEKEDALTALLSAAAKKIEAADPDMLNLRETLEYVKAAYSPVQAG
ncbi:hypothetical protein [[Clostridium] hylemonae]|uniref:hypothetical protein n=1 Tax=[Clostridium] hylemonae TaxID=89153 RepID=UPI001D064DDD|nr:hypothetical protein [[Clostridium] hylemonae]MCB7521557.1 hypothetical protein [[Clostridium] hylemonae]BDF05053.1 hypothetical protein CE91St63_21150 [[Clostridium] hylemonae]